MPATKTNVEKSSHYNGEVNILFYPDSHRYRIEGEKEYLIGVTTATGMLDKSRPLMIWSGRIITDYLREKLDETGALTHVDINEAQMLPDQKKEEAASKGTLVHAWAEAWIKDQALPIPEDEQVRNGALAFLKWVKENDIKFLFSEKRVYSRKYGYVGTFDVAFTMGIEDHAVKHPGDFKTSSGIYFEMAAQVSAYQHAETEEHGTVFGDKCVIRFDKDTAEFQVKWFPASEHKMHLRAFLAMLELKKQVKQWDKTHNDYYKKNF